MADYIDKLEVDYDTWYVYKKSDNSYEYSHWPDSQCGADMQNKITITWENGAYTFDAQDYCEIYGSGGWNRWTSWEEELKNIVLKDAMERINHDSNDAG
jgi:hypothetical protein